MKNDITVAETKAQDALDMVAGHLIDPLWQMKHGKLNKEQQNTLIVNRIYRDFPRGFRTLPWILKNAFKEMIKNW